MATATAAPPAAARPGLARQAGSAYRWLAIVTAVFTYALIVMGSVVRVTGSGLGCPDWPTCYGQLIPPPDLNAWIEWSHRTLAALTSPLILATSIGAWLWQREDRLLLTLATLTPVLLAMQILLGAVVVLLELPTMVVMVHLGFALAILGLLVWIAVAAGPPLRRVAAGEASTGQTGRGFLRFTAFTTGFVFLLLLVGAYVRASGASWACAGFPRCNGAGLLPFGQFSALADIQLLHRLLAYIALGLVIGLVVWAHRGQPANPALRRATILLLLAILAQAAIGAAAVSTGVPPLTQALHVAGAAATWAAMVVVASLAYRTRPTDPAWAEARAAGTPRSVAQGPNAIGPVIARERGPLREAAALDEVEREQQSVMGEDPADSGGRHGFHEPLGRHQAVPGGQPAGKLRWLELMGVYVELTKPRVMSLLLATTFGAMVVAAGGLPPLGLLFWTMLGGMLASGGASSINHYLDRDIDPLMGVRTAARPVPAGRIPPRHALWFGVALGVAAFAVLTTFVNVLAAGLAMVGLLGYVFVYTLWLKRSSPSNIVIGGAAGAVPPLVGWAAVTNSLDLTAYYLFAIVFFWTPPHFWALALLIQKHYAEAHVPMLPVVRGERETRWQILLYSALLVALTVVLFSFKLMGVFYLLSALVLGGFFLYLAGRLWVEASRAAARRLYTYSLLYLAALFAAMAVDRVGWTAIPR